MSGMAHPRTLCAPTLDAVAELVRCARLPLHVETQAQAELARMFVTEFGPAAVSREHRLSGRDRPDFLLAGGIVVELKGPRHREPAILRQLQRYAEHDVVTGFVLGTARAVAMPWVIGERALPLRVVNLGSAWL